jgi:hypothetical protein
VAVWEKALLNAADLAGGDDADPSFSLFSHRSTPRDRELYLYASQCAVAASLTAASLEADLHSGFHSGQDENPPLAAATTWLDCNAFHSALIFSTSRIVTTNGRKVPTTRQHEGNDPWCIFITLYMLHLSGGGCSCGVLDAVVSALTSSQTKTLEIANVFGLCDAIEYSDQMLTEVLCSYLQRRASRGDEPTNATALELKANLRDVTAKMTLPVFEDSIDASYVWDSEEQIELVTIFVQWLLSRRWKQSLSTVVSCVLGSVDVSFLAHAVGVPWMMIDDKTTNVLCGGDLEHSRCVKAHFLCEMLGVVGMQ